MKFFKLKQPDARTYQYAWKDAAFVGFQNSTCVHCGRGAASMVYDGPHCLLTEGGAKYPDYLAFCGAGEPLFVISKRAAAVFQSAGLSGIGGFTPVRVMREAEGTLVPLPGSAPDYVLVQITGKIDLDHTKMCLKKKRVCGKCGGFEWNRQRMHPLYLNESTWDGSDICRNTSIPGYIIFSEAAVEAVRRNKLKGFGFDSI